MSNWFAGINQAGSGLNAARYGLSVVSQNIANADTPGYTRQTSVQGTTGTGNVASIQSARTTTSDTLGGVQVTGTQRSDDPVLDARVRSEHARGALADTTSSTFSGVESLFPEPSDSGLGSQLGDFWSAWSSVATDPGTSATRGVLLQKANTVVATLNTMSSSLSDVVTQTASDLDTDLSTVNTTAAQLADLNGQIAIGTATGSNVNSLLDQRDQLLDTLSTTVGAGATINANGTATVTVGGQTLVSGTTAGSVSADASHQVSVNGTAVTLTAGSAAARVTALTTTLPGYQAQLDAVANALTSTVNAVQSAGYDLNGAAGTAMFSGSGAAGITVAITDPSKIAASATPGGTLDGSNALAASRQGTASNGPDATYTALVGDVAGASSLAQQQAATQDSVVSNVDDLKASISGVNYDEEVSTMLVYQRSFQASSRVLTTLDDMLDTLINHTGHVGLA